MTAVEWLVEEFRDTILKEYAEARFLELVEYAKEMEKAQIIDSFDKGGGYPYNTGINHAEQYYNKTFKSE